MRKEGGCLIVDGRHFYLFERLCVYTILVKDSYEKEERKEN